MRFTSIAVALLSGAALAVSSGGELRAQTPKDTVVMAKQIDDIISLDPAEAFEFSGVEAIANVYDKLLTFNLKNVSEIRGELAQTWEVAADGKTYTFKMRPGVKFHSGNPVTATDVAYSLQRAVMLNKSPGFILTPVRLHQGQRQGEGQGDRRQHARDRDREGVRADVLLQLPDRRGRLGRRHEDGRGQREGRRFRQRLAEDQLGRLRRLHACAHGGPTKATRSKPTSGTGRARRRPSASSCATSRSRRPSACCSKRATSTIARNLTKDQLDALGRNANIKLDKGLKGSIFYISLNQKNPILAKPEVREALKWLVDYDAIEKNIVAGTHTVHQSFLPNGFLGAIEDKPVQVRPRQGARSCWPRRATRTASR